jgi:hypothetical protein
MERSDAEERPEMAEQRDEAGERSNRVSTGEDPSAQPETPTAEPAAPTVAVILTQVAVPEVLAGACAFYKLPIDVVPSRIGAVAYCRSTHGDTPELTANVVSGLLTNTEVVLVVNREGRMTATRWANGERIAELPAVLMLDGAPPEVERLLLGRIKPAELPGTVTSVGMSRWRAARILSRAARREKRVARSRPARERPASTR